MVKFILLGDFGERLSFELGDLLPFEFGDLLAFEFASGNYVLGRFIEIGSRLLVNY